MRWYARIAPNTMGQPHRLILSTGAVQALGWREGMRLSLKVDDTCIWVAEDPLGAFRLRRTSAWHIALGRLALPGGLNDQPHPAYIEDGVLRCHYKERLSREEYNGIRFRYARLEKPVMHAEGLALGDNRKRYSTEQLLHMVGLLKCVFGAKPSIYRVRREMPEVPVEVVTQRLGWPQAVKKAPDLPYSPEEARKLLEPFMSTVRRATVTLTLEQSLLDALVSEALGLGLSVTQYMRELLRARQPLDVERIQVDSPAKQGHLAKQLKAAGRPLKADELIRRGLLPYHDAEWLKAQLEAGKSCSQLAAEFGGSGSAYHKAAQKAGLTHLNRHRKKALTK